MLTKIAISTGGWHRLRTAIEAETRAKYEKELASAIGYWKRRAIEGKIRKEVEQRMQRGASPYSLWSASRFRGD
jgi:hypothetical protein